MVYYLLCIPIFAAYALTLRRLAFDRRAIAILLAAFLVSLSAFFHPQSWLMFTADIYQHTEYIAYITEHHALPPLSLNAAARHPPTYYILASAFQQFGSWVGDRTDPLDYPRYLSLILFSAFWVMAALTIRALFPKRDGVYYVCLALMAFWPIGMSKPMTINCDILLYAPEMGWIFFVLRHLQTRSMAWLSGAAYAAGLAILAKNNALLLVIMTLGFLAAALWRARGKWRSIFRPRLLLALLFMGACTYSTLGRDHLQHVTFAVAAVEDYTLYDWVYMYGYFDLYEFLSETVVNPHTSEPMFHFWHFYLRTLLLGASVTWNGLGLLFAYGFVWIAMIIYMLHWLWRAKRLPAGEQGVWHFLLAMAALLTGMLLYRFHNLSQPNLSADGRYVYPIIVIIVAFYGKAMQWHAARGQEIMVQVGRGLGLGFVLLSVGLVVAQDYVWSKPTGAICEHSTLAACAWLKKW